MNIVIYNTNSFGGNYEYSKELAAAYSRQPGVEKVTVIVPHNAADAPFFKKLTLPDIPPYSLRLMKKLYFLYRSVKGPLQFRRFLKGQPASCVIFNDYDQISAFLWVPLFRSLRKKHLFAVILHDPDRDQYLPSVWLSSRTMASVMSLMDIAFYHELLPEKSYYDDTSEKVVIPHGIYKNGDHDERFLQQLLQEKGNNRYISILGNIRDEKNYRRVIECLPFLPHTKLLVIGKASHSSVDTKKYLDAIRQLGVEDKVVWKEQFMTDAEFQSAIIASDIVLLYYKESFTSQSGVLNLLAAHKKPVIVSDYASALRETIHRFGIGKIVPEQNESFISAVKTIEESQYKHAWDSYLAHASWDENARIGMAAFSQAQQKCTH